MLERVPSHMSYNVSLLDTSGDTVVAAVAPDRTTSILKSCVATNHQHGTKWTRYDRATRSAERERYLAKLLANKKLTSEAFAQSFLRPPLYNTRYARALGTLYTAIYNPTDRSVRYLWPNDRVDQSIDAFETQDLVLQLGAPSPPAGTTS